MTCHESEDINEKAFFLKFQLIQILRFQVMHECVSLLPALLPQTLC